MLKQITEIFKTLGELLLPRICYHCGERIDGTPYPVCLRCEKRISPRREPVCYLCGAQKAVFTSGGRCKDCPRGTVYFHSLLAVTGYQGLAKFAIEKLKYDLREEYSPFMADAIGKTLSERGWDKRFDIIVPVPLFHARERERGFNQSMLLAADLQKWLDGCQIVNALKRIRATVSQTRLSRSERVKNIQGAFVCIKADAVRGKRILIIDDVGTTCSTLNECARILMENGAEEVRCAVFAKAGM